MRGGRVALLVAMLAMPLALADAVETTDPLGDERTTTSLKLLNSQPPPFECHDLSVDVARTAITRDATTVVATYRVYGLLAVPTLECDGQPLAPSDRGWGMHLSTDWLPFTGKTTSTAGEPDAPCMRAYWGSHGYSGCVGTVTVLPDGFTFALPVTDTLRFDDGQDLTYSLAGELYARGTAHSRATLVSPSTATLYGTYDWGETELPG